jgi:hypothetical protein
VKPGDLVQSTSNLLLLYSTPKDVDTYGNLIGRVFPNNILMVIKIEKKSDGYQPVQITSGQRTGWTYTSRLKVIR